MRIKGYVDSDSQKWGGVNNGLPIYAPDEIPEGKMVIVTSSWYRDISKVLLEKGFIEGTTFFSNFSFMVQYMYWKEHVIHIPSTALVITEKCSMRCKYCSRNIPYIVRPRNYDIEEVINSLNPFLRGEEKSGIFVWWEAMRSVILSLLNC